MLPASALPEMKGRAPFAMLEGIRILDFTTSIAGPYGAMLLGDLGAEVVKVERPGRGDDSRAWGPPFLDGESLWFLSVNRNKSSITLDYASETGRPVLHDLVRAADVVITNLVPRVQAKLGIDARSLQAIRPDLIHVSLTGFGVSGGRSNKSAYDLIAEGYSGIMDVTGEAETPPQKVGTPAADMLAGMDAVIGTIAALFERSRTGNGHVVDISMVESMTRFLTPRIVSYLGSGEIPRRTGARDSVIAIYQAFDTADDPITLGLGNDGLWRRFWDTLGEPERGRDSRFATNAQRHAHRAMLVADIQSRLLAEGRAHWLSLFDRAGIPAGPINRVDEIACDEALVERGFFFTLAKGERVIPQVGLGIQIDGQASGPRLPPPDLGEHSAAVLRGWAGYDDGRLGQLRDAGVI